MNSNKKWLAAVALSLVAVGSYSQQIKQEPHGASVSTQGQTGSPLHTGSADRTSGRLALAAAGVSGALTLAPEFSTFEPVGVERSFRSDVHFFETVLSHGKNTDPRLIFLLVNGYLNHQQHQHGLAFFEQLLASYGNTMTASMRAHTLAAYALVRASYANQLAIYKRPGWVLDTFDLLDQARELTDGTQALIHWASGIIYAEVPSIFFKRDDAYRHLNWLAVHPEAEPLPGFFREAYRYLAKLHRADGDTERADHFLAKAGYDEYQPNALFSGQTITTRAGGAAMVPSPRLKIVVPDRVFALLGFSFSEFYFVVSDDRKQLIAIDAGVQASQLLAAHRYLAKRVPDLPPLSTAIITHAHWDHIGGFKALKTINRSATIIGRANYSGTLARVLRPPVYRQFRGTGFKLDDVKDYRPDVAIDSLTKTRIGGTTFELIPVAGGETEDGMLIYLPDLGVLFAGDVVMPFYGEPWVEEGSIDDVIDTLNEIIKRRPRHLLHGHAPLTLLYGPAQIEAFRDAFTWLVATSRRLVRHGYSVKDIVRLNLVPDGLQNRPDVFLAYVAPRDHIIARVADNLVGIWHEDISGQEPEGLDNLTAIEYGRLLDTYLDLSVSEVAEMLRKTLAGGDNELALKMVVAAIKRYGDIDTLRALKLKAIDRLRSSNHFTDPFRFIVYSEMIGKEHKPIQD